MRKISYEELCKNWEIDPVEHREIFEWLKADPRDEQGRLTRQVGLRKPGGVPEKLKRQHSRLGTHFYSLVDNMIFSGSGVSVSSMDFNMGNLENVNGLVKFIEAEQEAFDKAGIEIGTVEFTCPMCSGKAVGNRYKHNGRIHGLGSGCIGCELRHT